jgi:Zn-dependent protease with chaperone function
MATETVSAPQKPRLNPFAFPSDTDFRFVLLIVTVLAVSIFYILLLVVANDIPFIQQKWADGYTACGYQVFGTNFDQLLNQVADSSVDYNTALWDQYYACKLPFEIEKTLWVLGCITLLIGIATLLYWFFPAWKIRRDRLLPLTVEDAPEVVKFLTGLCREVELKQSPTFLWNPLNNTSSGLAFGRLGKYYVALSGGLVTQFYTDPSAFRAVLLHELSHLKNADVDKAYFATAIWQAFLLIIILPYASLHFGSLLGNLLTGFITLIALVYLTRNSVLRSRELYADARADMLGEKHALETVLAALPNQQGNILQSMKVHPAPSERRRMLFSSEGLFQPNFWIAVAAGMAFSIMKGNIKLLYSGAGVSLLAQSIISALLFALLVVGILGLGIWRAAFAKLILGNISIGKGRLAFGITLGILVDYFMRQTNTVLKIFLILFWSGILFLALYALFHWIASTAESWLEVAASLSSPRRIYLMNLAFAVIISSTVFTWLLMNLGVIETTSPTDLLQAAGLIFLVFGTLFVSVTNPFVWLALASLWAVPMAAWFWRKQAMFVKTASWAYLDSPQLEELQPHSIASSWQPGFAIQIGIKLGILYCGILLIIRILVRVSGLGDVINGNDSYQLAYIYVWVVLAVLMQIGAAVVVSGKVKKISWAHGLFAAFVGGCVMTIGILAINTLLRIMDGKIVSIAVGGGLEPALVWQVFSQVINFGTFFALIPAIVASTRAERKR